MYHLAANHYYWYGDYERAMSASESSFTTAGVELHSQEFRLRGAGSAGIILASLGRYEEAIAAAEYAIELGRDMGRPVGVVMNYSTLPLREIFSLDDALTRSEGVADILGPSDFNMPWMNAGGRIRGQGHERPPIDSGARLESPLGRRHRQQSVGTLAR